MPVGPPFGGPSLSWSATVRRLVNSELALLVFRGRMPTEAMRAERVTEVEVLAAARTQGMGALEEI